MGTSSYLGMEKSELQSVSLGFYILGHIAKSNMKVDPRNKIKSIPHVSFKKISDSPYFIVFLN